MKKVFPLGIMAISLIILLLALTMTLLTHERKEPAFLGTMFNMTFQEVQQALKHHGIQLVDIVTFEKLKSTPKTSFINQFASPLFYENEKYMTRWYMPSIEMFDSQVVAEFEFYRDRLIDVELHVLPISKRNTHQVVHMIKKQLAAKFSFVNKQYYVEEKSAAELRAQQAPLKKPDAYSLNYQKNKTHLNVWVNLAEAQNPIIQIYISPFNPQNPQPNVKQRQQVAFN